MSRVLSRAGNDAAPMGRRTRVVMASARCNYPLDHCAVSSDDRAGIIVVKVP